MSSKGERFRKTLTRLCFRVMAKVKLDMLMAGSEDGDSAKKHANEVKSPELFESTS